MRASSVLPDNCSETKGYGALIVGGPLGIAARVVGAIPRKLTADEVRTFREILDAGFSIQIIMPDRETFERHKANLYVQLGLRRETLR